MKKFVLPQDKNPSGISPRSALEEVLREGARKMLQEAIETEVAEYIQACQELRDEMNRRLVIRNGHLPSRDILTGIGSLSIRQPRVRDKRESAFFSSAILRKYKRRAPSLDAAIPELYLRGISTNNFPEALAALLGEKASGLSSTNITRLKEVWEREYRSWQEKRFDKMRYVYIWADGIYFNIRLDEDRPCMLVLIGATEDGKKEFIGLHDGSRESKQSWKDFLQNLKSRGLVIEPSLAVGDGALGFWAALEEEYPRCRQQRCWVHKTANILDKMPKSVQPNAKRMIHEMYMSPTKEKALKAYDEFLAHYSAKYSGAAKCLEKDKEQMFNFYDFPAEHWQHIRTTNPIESTFATVRHRSRQTKGCGSRMATLTMVYKLGRMAEKGWRRLRGFQLLSKVVDGVKFKDGEEVIERVA
ncbi:MAG: IS256 family transposase [Rhabdochlamydiaceae bacterium]